MAHKSYISNLLLLIIPQLYKQILRQKLAWSMQDWMGVILLGTKDNDTDVEWKNIQILQQLRIVTLDDLQHIRKLGKDI